MRVHRSGLGRALSGAALVALVYLCAAVEAHALGFGFATLPADGAIGAAAGEATGWGYRVTNPSAERWLALAALDAGSFTQGLPDAGLFDFPVLAPGEVREVAYDGVSGLYGFRWSMSAAAGSVNAGQFVLAADWFAGDPLANGVYLEAADDALAAYRVAVIPEPGVALMTCAGLAGIAASRRGRRG